MDSFPFSRVLSLHKLINAWSEIEATTQSAVRKELARDLLGRAEAIPELTDGVMSVSEISEHSALIDELMSIVVPVARADNALIGAMAPFSMDAFFGTPAFHGMLASECDAVQNGKVGGFDSVEDLMRAKIMNAFHVILEEFYGVQTIRQMPTLFIARNPDGTDTYYRIQIDTQFVDIQLNGDKPKLTSEQIKQLANDPANLELWVSLLPPDRFVFKGFGVITLLNITEHEVQSRLKNDLLQRDALTTPSRLNSIEHHLRSLLGIADLRIGVIGLATGKFEDIERSQTFGRSLLLGREGVPACPMRDNSTYAELFATGEPVTVSDLEECTYCTGFEHRIREQDFRGLMLVPLKDGDRLTGVLELATWTAGKLNTFSAAKLMEVVALFSAAMLRSLDERSDRIQALIKKEFTSIHPSVEWKFRTAAEKLDQQTSLGEKGEPDAILFEDVYPLYGLSDIRDSTVQRNAAIQVDLIEQLGLALSVIVEASSSRPLPALDELGFRIAKYGQMIEEGLTSDIEVGALEFLRNDVEPLFERLAGGGDAIQDKITAYNDAIDSRLGVLYNRRREYEEAVASVNKTISSFLQRQQTQAQSMYPHYFEKFETDGVDYNAYIGESIAKDQPFDSLYLHNLRLWQLQTMCGVVWELEKNSANLAMPLKLAHLILVQDFPIAIRFSKDEKQFGVDGAYNARYMIVKKRIDKARVKGSSERITQTGKIAIVYAQEKERREYMRYLEYLSAAGYIEGPIEELEVEPLQGVNGLRVLRVQVSDVEPAMEVRARPDLAAKVESSKSADEGQGVEIQD